MAFVESVLRYAKEAMERRYALRSRSFYLEKTPLRAGKVVRLKNGDGGQGKASSDCTGPRSFLLLGFQAIEGYAVVLGEPAWHIDSGYE
jgi:hypothetical protein